MKTSQSKSTSLLGLQDKERLWWYDHYMSNLADVRRLGSDKVEYIFATGSDIRIDKDQDESLEVTLISYENEDITLTSKDKAYRYLFDIKNYAYHRSNSTGEWVVFYVDAGSPFIMVYHNQVLHLVEEFEIGDLEQTLISIVEEYERQGLKHANKNN